ncbi:MAG: PHP domain-containing protein [Clostridia bacterium]|nr:PHP domain-containing protein [Clostridia bacterium]
MIRANFHTHTTLCDGKNTPAEMARAAFDAGFEALGFSGHMDPTYHMDFPGYLAEIAALRAQWRGRLDILCGVELDQRWDPATVAGAEYIIGSTHFLSAPNGLTEAVDWSVEKSDALCREGFGGDWYRMCTAYYEEEAWVWEKTNCQIIGHFDLIARFNHQAPRFDEEDPRYLNPAREALAALVAKCPVVEINCGAFNRGRRRDFYPARPLLRYLKEIGGEICLGSDAHQATLLAGGFPEAEAAARACGFDHALVLRHGASGRVQWETRPLK